MSIFCAENSRSFSFHRQSVSRFCERKHRSGGPSSAVFRKRLNEEQMQYYNHIAVSQLTAAPQPYHIIATLLQANSLAIAICNAMQCNCNLQWVAICDNCHSETVVDSPNSSAWPWAEIFNSPAVALAYCRNSKSVNHVLHFEFWFFRLCWTTKGLNRY